MKRFYMRYPVLISIIFLAALLCTSCASRPAAPSVSSSAQMVSSSPVSSQEAVSSNSTALSSAESAYQPVSSSSLTPAAAVSSRSYAVSSSSAASYSKPFPVLMYHSIAYEKGNSLRIPKEDFDAQMSWLKTNGYSALTLDELDSSIKSGRPFPNKAVAITFDDGYGDAYGNAFPVLKKYGFKATVFMITDDIDKPAWLTSAQLREMSDYGIEIESHTVTHPHLDKLTYAQQLTELQASRAKIEGITGKPVEFLAYPYGDHNSNSERAAKTAGYKMAFTMSGPWKQPGTILYEFPRVYIKSNLSGFIKGVQSGKTAVQ